MTTRRTAPLVWCDTLTGDENELLTFQDFEKAVEKGETLRFLPRAIQDHLGSEVYKTAVAADAYNRQRNLTVNNYTKFIAEHSGNDLVNVTAANNRIASNFFHRFNTQRCTYSLGNGVTFNDEKIKDKLGSQFDTDFYNLAYYALIHGECYGFWNKDRLYIFPVTEFVPLFDEHDGVMRAGIRFWRLAENKPLTVVLYEEDGYTKYVSRDKTSGYDLVVEEEKKAYLVTGITTQADGFEVTSYSNYSSLPVKRMQGSKLNQSTLVGLREQIDSYDLIQSGFANDLQDCAQIYWIIENCGGMSDADLQKFLNKLTRDHVATADTHGMGVESSSLKPYVQDVPFQARVAWLQHIRSSMYESFGALDVSQISAQQRTATEIQAAYEPMNENADDFEYQCIDFIQQVLGLMGIDAVPLFKRSRISNEKEQVEMVMLEAQYLDDQTVLEKLPNITVDEVARIMDSKITQDNARFEETEV